MRAKLHNLAVKELDLGSTFAFPVLGLWTPAPPIGSTDNERFAWFEDEKDLYRLRRKELRAGDHLGMLLVDNAGHHWSVRRVRSVGLLTPVWLRLLMNLLNQGGDVEHRVEYDLEDRGVVDFGEIKIRLCASLDRNSEEWADHEALGGHGGPPLVLDEVMSKAKAAVMTAVDIRTLADNLDAAWPYDEDGRARSAPPVSDNL